MQRLEDDRVKGKRRRVAICLVGAARAFELSGGSLKKYLLDASTDADVFLHSPLDKDSYKFLMLKGVSNLTAARIFIPQQLPESDLQRQVLTGVNSPNGIQVWPYQPKGLYLSFLFLAFVFTSLRGGGKMKFLMRTHKNTDLSTLHHQFGT
jgi:hypothetical protein